MDIDAMLKAAREKDAVGFQTQFNQELGNRIAAAIQDKRIEVARSLFQTPGEQTDENAE